MQGTVIIEIMTCALKIAGERDCDICDSTFDYGQWQTASYASGQLSGPILTVVGSTSRTKVNSQQVIHTVVLHSCVSHTASAYSDWGRWLFRRHDPADIGPLGEHRFVSVLTSP